MHSGVAFTSHGLSVRQPFAEQFPIVFVALETDRRTLFHLPIRFPGTNKSNEVCVENISGVPDTAQVATPSAFRAIYPIDCDWGVPAAFCCCGTVAIFSDFQLVLLLLRW